MKIKYKLMLTYGVLVLLAFVIVIVNIFIFKTMESDSNFVNYSGKLRATNYRMAQLSNIIINDIDKTGKEELEENIIYFESLISSLYEGDSELGISKLTNKTTLERMNHITKLWETRYKLEYTSILTSEDENSLRIINEEISMYVDFINEMVTLYSEDARLKVTRAKTMNVIISIITILVALVSFYFINKGVRKPISLLTESLKQLSFAEGEFANSMESASKDEIREIESYFNELIYDGLTKVYSRGSGLAKLKHMFQSKDRRQFIMSLCFIDVNGLKEVNDVLGHKYGDELIVSTVDIIKGIVRDSDFIIRFGGDEFLIVFNDINAETAESIWARISSSYDKINQEEDRPYLISVSHGIVGYDNKENIELNDLIRKADEKMYLEKRIIKKTLNGNVIKDIS